MIGAVLAGSAHTRRPDEPHPAGSDVDLLIFVDSEVPSEILEPHGRFAPRKLVFRGVVLEPSFHDARRIADPEVVLGDVHLAPVFCDPDILFDASGRLQKLASAVKPAFHQRTHIHRRLHHAFHPPSPAGPGIVVQDLPALRAPCWRNAFFAFDIGRAASAVLVAGRRYPTVRRSFIVAREVLCQAGREDLADALLRLLGSFGLSPSDVESLAAELERSYDVAVELRRTPVVMDWNVSRDARELERAAVREMIGAGYHRESLFHVLLLRTVVQGILENDAPGEVLSPSRAGYGRLLEALGIEGSEALHNRERELRGFMPVLQGFCEDLVATLSTGENGFENRAGEPV
ncbi:MAG: hypothetical protein U1F98_12330 [Verrucomicrobiota bacterium]